MTTQAQIAAWFDKGVKQKATHMIVVCDTFDYDDYPVYALSDKDALASYKLYKMQSMQRVMEVYDLRQDKAEQLNEHRVMRLPSDAETA